MREIKFRAWNEDGNRMHYMADGKKLGRILDFWELVLRYDFIIEQFTGLKDKNGKEIYEGDIVSTGKRRGKVFMRLGCWYVENYSELGYLQSPEIIGNIHENPELINE